MNTSAPAFIKFILHCYSTPKPFKNRDSSYHSELIENLRHLEMIEVGEQSDIWVLTEKGLVYCKAILKAVSEVPFPYYTCSPQKENVDNE